MLRATSEIAEAITVRSLGVRSSWDARCRPSWRAVTMSASVSIGMRISASTTAPPLRACVEVHQALFQVEGGGDGGQRQSQLHHRERHFRLDADDDRLRAA